MNFQRQDCEHVTAMENVLSVFIFDQVAMDFVSRRE